MSASSNTSYSASETNIVAQPDASTGRSSFQCFMSRFNQMSSISGVHANASRASRPRPARLPLSNRGSHTTRPVRSTCQTPSAAHNVSRNRVFTASNSLPAENEINTTLDQWLSSSSPRLPSEQRPARFGSLKILEETLGQADPSVENLSPPMAQPSQPEPQYSNITSHFGDPLPEIDRAHTLRIIYQNTWHSLHPVSSPSTNQLFQHLQELQCGVFCASESNVNWRNKTAFFGFRDLLTRAGWRCSSLSTSCSTFGDFEEHATQKYLPGGTATLSLDLWASKIIDQGKAHQHGQVELCLIPW